MRILTIIRHVPDSRAPVKLKPDGSGIENAGLRFVCDPFDEFGVEFAVRLSEQRKDVESITALTIGPAAAADSLRHAVAMGATRAVQVTDESTWDDEIRLARLAAAFCGSQDPGFDLILCGKQATDTDAGVIGPALAEILGWPHVGAATSVEFSDDARSLIARRRIEGAEEVVRASLPVLLTCEKGLVEPRQPALPKLMKAKKHPIETIAGADLGVPAMAGGMTRRRLTAPPPRPPCTMIVGDPETMAKELVRRLREEARVV